MTEYADRQIEQVLDDYQRQHSVMGEIHRQLQALTASAVSPRRELEVTVKHTGGVVSITFNGTAYRRMAGKELSALLMRTIATATEKAAAEAAELIAPTLPLGMDAQALMRGKVSFDALAPGSGPRMYSAVREQLER